jgi:menaquinone-dependent protoporphyrinogen IX oxidase
MKGLVLFRSHYGNTKQVAEAIAQQITETGHEAVVQDVRQKLPDLQGFDFVMVGSPTRFARADGKAMGALKQLRKKGFTGKPVAVFDTYGPVPTKPKELEKSRKWLYPGAAGKMHKLAEEQGLNVYPETLRCEVQGNMKGPLAEHQLEKTTLFTKNFISKITKNS